MGAFERACGCFTISYWSEYFDIDQLELKGRLMACAVPNTNALVEKISENPDLYGPFWICTTLIFMITFSKSFSGVITDLFTANTEKASPFDFNLIGLAISVIYGAFFIFPLAFILLNKSLGSSIPVINSACIYGYSFSGFLAASVISILPIGFIRKLTWLAAGAHSVVLLFFNFKP